jgi:hypothetical protein
MPSESNRFLRPLGSARTEDTYSSSAPLIDPQPPKRYDTMPMIKPPHSNRQFFGKAMHLDFPQRLATIPPALDDDNESWPPNDMVLSHDAFCKLIGMNPSAMSSAAAVDLECGNGLYHEIR